MLYYQHLIMSRVSPFRFWADFDEPSLCEGEETYASSSAELSLSEDLQLAAEASLLKATRRRRSLDIRREGRLLRVLNLYPKELQNTARQFYHNLVSQIKLVISSIQHIATGVMARSPRSRAESVCNTVNIVGGWLPAGDLLSSMAELGSMLADKNETNKINSWDHSLLFHNTDELVYQFANSMLVHLRYSDHLTTAFDFTKLQSVMTKFQTLLCEDLNHIVGKNECRSDALGGILASHVYLAWDKDIRDMKAKAQQKTYAKRFC